MKNVFLYFPGKEAPSELLKKSTAISSTSFFTGGSFVLRCDNLVALPALLQNYSGKVDLVYIDPPFNTAQDFSVSSERATSISRVKKGTIAYSDKQEDDLYIKRIYEVFVYIHELLSEIGSLYVHIDDRMAPYFKLLLDEVFGDQNYRNTITRIKSNPKNFSRRAYGNEKDVILFYAKDSKKVIWNDVRKALSQKELEARFPYVDECGRRFTTIPLHAPGESSKGSASGSEWRGMFPPKGRHWRSDPASFDVLDSEGRIYWSSKGNPRIKIFADEHKGAKLQDVWFYKDPQYPVYPTEKNRQMLELILRQSSNASSLVLDCFAGSGSFLLAAADLGRSFIGIDSSEVAFATQCAELGKKGIAFTCFDGVNALNGLSR